MTGKTMTMIDDARRYRESENLVGKGGVIVLFRGEVQGWVNELRNPEHWQPGCVAVDEQGRTWTTIAGNEYDGALMWLPNDQTPVPDDKCPRCGGALERGQALFSLSQVVRAAWEGETKPTLQDCLKCPSCGYSETLKSKL